MNGQAKFMTYGEGGLAAAFIAIAFVSVVVAAKAYTPAYAFHAYLFAAASAAMSGSSILVTLNALRGRLGRRPTFVSESRSSLPQAADRPVRDEARLAENGPGDAVWESATAARERLEYVQ